VKKRLGLAVMIVRGIGTSGANIGGEKYLARKSTVYKRFVWLLIWGDIANFEFFDWR
jgi:hypothetical protein